MESYAQAAASAIDSTTGSNLTQRVASKTKTPRKSRSKAELGHTDSEADQGSYAAVAGHAPSSDAALASTAPTTGKTPRKSRASTVRGEGAAGGSPMRMTRSRSKGRGLGESETDEQSD